MLSPLLVGPILRKKCLVAQCIPNTTRVCLKALEKRFFLLDTPEVGIQADTPTAQAPARTDWVQAEPAHKQTHPNGPARIGGLTGKTKTPRHTHHECQARIGGYRRSAHTNTHLTTPQPGMAGRSRDPNPSTHRHTAQASQEWRGTGGVRTQTQTSQFPSQEWWGAAETKREAHTATPRTRARNEGVQAERAHKHTQPNT